MVQINRMGVVDSEVQKPELVQTNSKSYVCSPALLERLCSDNTANWDLDQVIGMSECRLKHSRFGTPFLSSCLSQKERR